MSQTASLVDSQKPALASFQNPLYLFWQKNKLPLSLSLLGLFFLAAGAFSLFKNSSTSPAITIEDPEQNQSNPNKAIKVDVSGAVGKPGVYEFFLEQDPRVQDALVQAGGLNAEANRQYVAQVLNLAAPLVDGQKIFIPEQGEQGEGVVAGSTRLDLASTISLNTASQQELESLKGIGPARAQAIIENRPYTNVEQLLEKKIIPQSVYQNLKDKLSVY